MGGGIYFICQNWQTSILIVEMSLINTDVIKINKNDASNFMAEFELMGSIGLGVWHYGLVYDDEIISAVSYGTLCSGNHRGFLSDICKNLKCKCIQLCRGGTKLNAPKNSASKLICSANSLLRDEMGNIIIVAYADPEWREIGDVYQASNALYTGVTNPKGQSNYIINNEFLTGWQVYKKFGTRCMSNLKDIDPNVKKYPLAPKHRYLFVCGDKRFKKEGISVLTEHSLEYPKRNRSNSQKLF